MVVERVDLVVVMVVDFVEVQFLLEQHLVVQHYQLNLLDVEHLLLMDDSVMMMMMMVHYHLMLIVAAERDKK